MKKLWCVGLLLTLTLGCGRAIVVLRAQTLPVTKTVAWDANPSAEQVLTYTVTLDGAGPITVTAPLTSAPVTFATAGTHTLRVTATNLWGTSAPAVLVVDVRLPANVGGLRIVP